MAEPVKEFALLVAELVEAQAALCEAQAAASLARSIETQCLNRANEASKSLDLAFHTLRKSAPKGTNWHHHFVAKVGEA